jgi:hypothetical protein
VEITVDSSPLGFSTAFTKNNFMKHFLILMLVCFPATLLYSQSANEEAAKKTFNAFMLAVQNNDAAAAENLLTNDYRMDGHGEVRCITNKTQRLSSIRSGQIKFEAYDFENKANQLYLNDTTASIIGGTLVTYKTCEDPGKELTTRTIVFVFVKREERWQISIECIGANCVR